VNDFHALVFAFYVDNGDALVNKDAKKLKAIEDAFVSAESAALS
jgi:hypothetical protein